MIPSFYGVGFKSTLTKGTVWGYVFRCEFNLFPTAFFRSRRNTSSVFRLPRCLCLLKCSFFSRVDNFFGWDSFIGCDCLREYNQSTGGVVCSKFIEIFGVVPELSTRRT